MVYNDSGTGNPAFLGDYLLVTNEVASSYGIPCSDASGLPVSPGGLSRWPVYALEEALEQYAAGGEHCADMSRGTMTDSAWRSTGC
ncbi:hypothetical protein EG850_12295 [Gulosibacter macacae]|uniref:Uncharacterized protein n=1 Tax=Gulosibacter macacae TaxID=2488791 RepID=A0A3P3VVP3_9MICO|nr:hypothetical protein [Gulosibacter macacae]RRJ85696.1 hypothetical protein EG850_12295 [Gulosibacter macacae]